MLKGIKGINYNLLILAIFFAITIFLQCVLFQWRMTNTLIISSLWKNCDEFLAFYLSKFAVSIFVTSFVFLFKKKYWIICISILIDIWMFIELIYYRAYGFLLDSSTMLIATNMNGFMDSLLMYITIADFIILFPTIILIIIYTIFKTKEDNKIFTLILILFAFILETLGMFSFHSEHRRQNDTGKDFEEYNELLIPYDEYHFNPFTKRAFYGMYDISNVQITSEKYVRYHSVIHHLIYNLKEIIKNIFTGDITYKISNKDKDTILKLCFNKDNLDNLIRPNNNLIIILIESLENWVVRPDVMPNLCNFIEKHNEIFWATKIKRQILAGGSADGQLIINTGLLPINEGAACFKFPQNVYPSLSNCYTLCPDKKSVVLVPHDLTVWNQNLMSKAYSIQENIVTGSTDGEIMNSLVVNVEDYNFIMAITFSTHNPFDGHIYSSLRTPNNMPEMMSKYIKANNYLDACMKDFLSLIDSIQSLKESTIVFVGDHTVFYPEQRNMFNDYCLLNGLDYDVTEPYGPLIIYSPEILKKEIYKEPAYQMDVYPTILNTIGCGDYYWKGVGINLRDSLLRKERHISEEEAFIISDKLIRADFFRDYLYKLDSE